MQADVPVTPDGSRSPTLERVIVWSAGSLATYIALAVLVAVVGVLSALVAGSMAVIVGVAWVFFARRIQRPTLVRLPLWAVVAVGVVAIVLTTLNIAHGAEHYLNDRDPGVYLTTAQWVRSNGSLVFDGALGPFSGIEGVNADWVGFYPAPGGHQYAQFSHGLPVLLASVGFVGGTGAMLGMNAIVGGLSVVLLALVIVQSARPVIAVSLAGLGGASLSYLYFVRDTYSEPLVLLLVLFALVCLDIARRIGSAEALVASGVAIGATTIVRIDGWLLVVGWLALMVVWMVAPRRPEVADRVYERAMLGLLGMGGVAVLDLALRSPDYVLGRRQQVVLLGLSVFVALATWLACFRFRDTIRDAGRRHLTLGRLGNLRLAAGAIVGFGLVFALVARPSLLVARGAWRPFVERLTAEAGLVPDGARTFAELTLVWFTWYWGWIAVAGAIAGVVVIIARRGPIPSSAGTVLILVGFAFFTYAVRPSIFPDQVWAMRRFLPSASIALPVALGVGIEAALVRAGTQPFRRATVAALAVIVLVATAVSVAITTAPLVDYAHQAGLRTATEDLCASLPEDVAVVVADPWLSTRYAASILAHCGVPTASADEVDVAGLERIADQVYDMGWVPVVVSAGSLGLEGVVLSAGEVLYPVADDPVLHPPRGVATLTHRWHAVEVAEEG